MGKRDTLLAIRGGISINWKHLLALSLLFVVLGSYVFGYSYNDTIENDNILRVTSDREVYPLNIDGNYYVYLEVENTGGVTYNDIDFEIYVESGYENLFQVTNIQREQMIWGPVETLVDRTCSKVNQITDLNAEVRYVCADNGRRCESQSSCSWKEKGTRETLHSRFVDYTPQVDITDKEDPAVAKRFGKMKSYKGFAIASGGTERYKITVTPTGEVNREIEFVVVAKSASFPEAKSVLDPAFGSKIMLDDFEDNWGDYIGYSGATTCIQETTTITEGSSSAECVGDGLEDQWAGNWTGGTVDISNETGVSSGVPTRGQFQFDMYVTDIANLSGNVWIYIGNSNSVNCRYDLTDANFSTGWNTVVLDMTQCNVVGTPDWTAVDYFSVLVNGSAQTYYFDNLFAGAISSSTADVNVDYPMNNETFDTKTTTNVDINFYIQANDANTFLVDINYSTSQSQGTGTPIIQDINTSSATIICESDDFSSAVKCTYDWNISGVSDGNYYILMDINSSTGAVDFDAGVRDFNVWSSDLYTIIANHSYPTPSILDPENGISSVNINFTDLSTCSGCTIEDWNWLVNGTLQSNNQNATLTFNSPADYNVSLIVYSSANGGITDQLDTNISILQYPQDVNFSWRPEVPSVNADSNFFGTATDNGTITNWTWGYQDGNAVDQNITVQFTSTGTKTVCLTVTDDTDLNRMKCHNIPVAGSITMHFMDENTMSAIQATATINGNSVSVDANGLMVYPLAGESSGTFTIVADASGYSTRTWEIDANEYSEIDINAALLANSNSQSIGFKFYSPELSLLSNAWVTVNIGANMKAGIRQLDSSAETTFILNPNDNNYSFYIETDTNTYSYDMALLIIKIPKEEKSLLNITPFSVSVSGIGSQDWNNLEYDINFYAFTNTKDTYDITVDANSDYYSRTYSYKLYGDTDQNELQPYLSNAANSLSVTFYVMNNWTLEPLPDITIVSNRNIPGVGWTEIETVATDYTGTALMSFIINQEYLLNFYSDGTLVYSPTIKPYTSPVYVRLDLSDTNYTMPESPIIDVNFSPAAGDLIIDEDGNITVGELVTSNQSAIQWIWITVYQGSTSLFDTNYSSGVGYGANYSQEFDSNVLNQFIPIKATVTIGTADETLTFTQSWFMKPADQNYNMIGLLNEVGTYFGEFFQIIIAVFVAIAAVGAATIKAGIRDTSALSFIALAVFGAFFIIGWLPLWLLSIAIIGAIAVFVIKQRWGV